MPRWEYLHVRAKVGITDPSPSLLDFTRKTSAEFLVNGKAFEVEFSRADQDIYDSVFALLNKLGEDEWELVSYSERERDLIRSAVPRTDYTFFMKRPKQ